MANACGGDLTIDHVLQEVTWLLPASKTDPQAKGVRRTLGCLCGVPGLPCPFHLALDHTVWLASFAASNGLALSEVPLFPAASCKHVLKSAMISTFESAALKCGLDIRGPSGNKLFGGHSLRVTGAQALARVGLDVNKLRILARHSGDMILRYVADVPLSSIRSDLGLTSLAAGGRPGDDIKKLKASVDKALRRISA